MPLSENDTARPLASERTTRSPPWSRPSGAGRDMIALVTHWISNHDSQLRRKREAQAAVGRLRAALHECADLYEMTLIANGAKPEMAAMHAKRFRDMADDPMQRGGA